MSELEKLIKGFKHFRKRYYEEDPEFYKQLTYQGQSPKILVIACCDSRVHPAQVMNTDPGDIFVIRNVANVVPPCEDDGKSHGTSAALEYAVKHLGVKRIIVFGHSFCGGIKSLMEGEHHEQDYGFIDPWMSVVEPAREKILKTLFNESFENQCRACEREVISISLQNLMTFPWVKDRVEKGDLSLHGWYFDIEEGNLYVHSGSENAFNLMV